MLKTAVKPKEQETNNFSECSSCMIKIHRKMEYRSSKKEHKKNFAYPFIYPEQRSFTAQKNRWTFENTVQVP